MGGGRGLARAEDLRGGKREEAIWRGRLPAERLEGWAHALHAGAAVPYSVEVERDGNAVEEVTVPYIEEQEVVVGEAEALADLEL
eukprot:COSAG04_NODE_27454_length_283_cov_0.483696_1_plen_84_part_01